MYTRPRGESLVPLFLFFFLPCLFFFCFFLPPRPLLSRVFFFSSPLSFSSSFVREIYSFVRYIGQSSVKNVFHDGETGNAARLKSQRSTLTLKFQSLKSGKTLSLILFYRRLKATARKLARLQSARTLLFFFFLKSHAFGATVPPGSSASLK